MDILNGESSDDDPVTFKINKEYAKGYDTWRKNEERQKLLDRYGEDADESSSSTEEEEIRSTKQMDKDWLRAYAVIHFKQPRLYKEGAKFFHDDATPDTLKKKEKATTLKDHERKFILEKGGVESDEDSKPISMGKSYFEEQEEIKNSLKVAIGDVKEEEDGGFLVKKEKSDGEKRKEENEYLEWLKGEREELMDKDAAAELAPLKAYWNDPSLSEKEKVLRDYILNNGYMDEDDSDDSEGETEAVNFAEEEEFLVKAEVYEHKYNFRHEEPGADEIKSYPRVIETSVRNKNTTRAEKRKRRVEKKNLEKEKRNEEIRLLQKLQMEQRKEKMDRLKRIAKNPRLEYDLEEDFDPEKHDEIMQKCFDEEYYGEGPSEKPQFEHDPAVDGDDEGDGDESDDKEDDNEKHDDGCIDDEDEDPGVDDPNFNMDADYDPDEEYESEQIRKKKYGKAFAKKLPLFDPKTKTFDEYIDEFLRDKINNLPFTYREVVPNSFGLSTEEILKAPVRELNSWVSVKKMSQYRSKSEELADKRKFAVRASLPEKKFKVLPSLLEKPEDPSKKGSKKKKKKKKKVIDGEKVNESEDVDGVTNKKVKREKRNRQEDSDLSVVGKKRKRKMEDAGSHTVNMTCETEAGGSFQLNEQQVDGSKKKKQKRPEDRISEAVLDTNMSNNEQQEVSPTKPKKKKKVLELEDHIRCSSVKKRKLNSNLAKLDAASMKNANTKDMKIHNDISNGDMAALDSLPAQSQEKGTNKKNLKSLSENKKLKKSSKKKVSISNFSKKKGSNDALALGSDTKKIKQALSQVMSTSRLSNYGFGPSKGNKKQKTRKKRRNKEHN